MRIDNSARGNAIFVAQLAATSQNDSQTDREPQEQLKNRINSIKNDGLSLKPLTQAIKEQAQQQQPQMTITESMVNTNQRSARENIIKAISE